MISNTVKWKLIILSVFYGLFFSGAGFSASDIHGPSSSNGSFYETSLLRSIQMLQKGDLEAALEATRQHLESFPKSQVGHLIQADILHALSAQTPQLGPAVAKDTKQLNGLKHQIKNRWMHERVHHSAASSMVPANLVMMGKHKFVLLADLHFGRLYLYQNNNGYPQLIRDYYMSVGKEGYGKQVEGDNKTPVGVYSIYKHIEGAKLPDLYGKGAFPVDYPNRYDKSLKRTGYGIWLHGTPRDTYARAPWSSEGCFVLSNNDLLDVQQYLDVEAKPPVILSDSIEWIDQTELQVRRLSYLKILENWKQDWESLDMQAYLNHYSRDKLNFGKTAYEPWAKKQIALHDSKTFLQVTLKIEDLFLYPGESDMFIVRFKQQYLSNNLVEEVEREQYWQRDAEGHWKIIYEG